jgi:predicted nuclease with TOPRIM domain
MEIIEEFNKDSYLEKLRKRLKQMKVERKIIENEVKHMNIHLENLKKQIIII